MSDTDIWAKQGKSPQWQGHRIAAMVVRVVVFLCPVSVAAALGLLVSRSIPGTTVGALVVRVVITAAVALLAFIAVERLARRFLPLAALLRLNLVFPDRAPSRFSVALRSTSVRKLQQQVRQARESKDVAELAEKVVTLASALNTHDRRTRGHCERTRALADLIVEELRLSPAETNEVRWGAFLHDIGKLVVPPEILNKPGKPTTREWEVLKSHPEAGARLVEPLRQFLRSGVDAVGSHHENYDGSGYPAGLSGEQLPLAARIVSVADSFEVMTAVRAYKRPMSLQAAREELARGSGTQFDPHVVRAFLNVSLGRVHWTLGFAAWVAELPFLTFLPRVAAQLSATAGAGAVTPVVLPGIAAASLGAIAAVAPTATTSLPSSASATHSRATSGAFTRDAPTPASSSAGSPGPSTTSTPPASPASPGAADSGPPASGTLAAVGATVTTVGQSVGQTVGQAVGTAVGQTLPPTIADPLPTVDTLVAHDATATVDDVTATTTATTHSLGGLVGGLLGAGITHGAAPTGSTGSTTTTVPSDPLLP